MVDKFNALNLLDSGVAVQEPASRPFRCVAAQGHHESAGVNCVFDRANLTSLCVVEEAGLLGTRRCDNVKWYIGTVASKVAMWTRSEPIP